MAMKELARITLDAKQVRRACEQFVDDRISDDEQAIANVDAISSVTLTIIKKRAPRKAKVTA